VTRGAAGRFAMVLGDKSISLEVADMPERSVTKTAVRCRFPDTGEFGGSGRGRSETTRAGPLLPLVRGRLAGGAL